MNDEIFYQRCVDHLRHTGNFLPRDSQRQLLRMVGVLRDAIERMDKLNCGESKEIDEIAIAALTYNGERFIPKELRGDSYRYSRKSPDVQQKHEPSWGRSWNQKGGIRED